MAASTPTDEELLAEAIRLARDTKALRLGNGVRFETADVFGELFGKRSCVVIADDHTMEVAGRDVYDRMHSSGFHTLDPIVLESADLYAEYKHVDRIRNALTNHDAIPIAVGSGTINDLTKLSAHQSGRPYLSIATAASMDGYTAFGASITFEGSKQTFSCPAPLGVVADLELITSAPVALNASGYADLVAKVPAGADWILADAMGIEPINRSAWEMVQSRLRPWMENPSGIRQGDSEALRRLTLALMMSGFAMQAACTSRPASGAEHQFSHLWDMEHHTHNGYAPSHGFKVGIGSLASLALYQVLLEMDLENLNLAEAVERWPDPDENDREVRALFSIEEVAAKAREESRAKHIDRAELRRQLEILRTRWPDLRKLISRQIIDCSTAREMLRDAGCPFTAPQIGISLERLRESFRKAYHIRRRFTVLDLVRRAGIWDEAIERALAIPCWGEVV